MEQVAQVALRPPVMALSNFQEGMVQRAAQLIVVVVVGGPETRRLVEMLRLPPVGRAGLLMAEAEPPGVVAPAAVQVLPGLCAVAVAAEHIVQRVVLTQAVPVLVAR